MDTIPYQRPETIEAAKTAIATSGAMLVAGGQSVVPAMRRGEMNPRSLVDISRIAELSNIRVSDGVLSIGSLSSHAAVSRSAIIRNALPGLAAMAGAIADPAIRQRGTIGGAFVLNDPRGDYPASLLALDATIRTTAGDFHASSICGAGAETIPCTAIVTDVLVTLPQAFGYEKFRIPSFGNALVGVAIAKKAGAVRVFISGAHSSGAFRWAEAERRLEADFSAKSLQDIKPAHQNLIDDFNGSAAYRAHLAGVIARRTVDSINGHPHRNGS